MIRVVLIALCAVWITGGPARAEQPLLIFAASSMTNAIQEIADAFEAAGNGPTVTVFDATSRAARQIQQGAPAHVLISANSQWAEWLIACGPGDAATRQTIASNRLVLIGTRNGTTSGPPPAPVPFHTVLTVIGNGRLAIADPVGVPAGVYAREALKAAGIWEQVQPQLVQGDTVRTVLNWVRTGTADTGIVYATDARVVEDVDILSTIPSALHGPIVYEAVAVVAAPPVAERFMTFLSEPHGRAILSKHGFAPPPEETAATDAASPVECG